MKRASNEKDLHIHINVKSVAAFFAVILGLWFLYMIESVLILIFLGLILALALEPFVDYLDRKRIPHGISVFTVVFTLVGVLIGLGSIAFSPLIYQIKLLTSNFPFYLQTVLNFPGAEKYSDAVWSQLSSSGQQIFSYTLGAFSGAFSALLVMVFSIYLLLDFDNIRKHFISLFRQTERKSIQQMLTSIEIKLKDWLRGQLVLMFIIGLMSYVGLLIMGLSDYALALAVIAGLLEAVPIVGPTVSVIPAAIIGFTISTPTGIGVIGLYILIQQFENNLIVPKVMQRAVGFNPIITIIAFMIGGQLLGIIGAIVSLPILIIIGELLKYFKLYDYDGSTWTTSRAASR